MASFRQNEDVYESEDIPEVDRNVFNREEPKNPQIDLVHIDIDAAKKKFEGRILNFQGIDFSDSIAKKRLAAYGSSAYVLEVVGRDYPEPETPDQKFNRLTYEINELAEELTKKDYKSSNGLLTVSSVNQLLEELKDVKANKSAGKPTTFSTTSSTGKPSEKIADSSLLIPLEQRLRRLETLIGQHDGTKQAVADIIEELKLRCDSLNSVYVDAVEARLNQVLTKLDQTEERKHKAGVPSEFEAEVNETLTLMKKWDTTCINLPANVKKVQALHCLHEQAQHFSERLAQMTGIRDNIEKAVVTDRETLRELQMKAKEDFNSLTKQIEALQKRLDKLGK